LETDIPEGVSVLLVNTADQILLQQRDDKPGIANPGYISAFGGSLEPGEAPLDAAHREMLEETNLNLPKDRFKFFGRYRKTNEEFGEDRTIFAYIVDGIDDTGLEIYEGAGYHTIDATTDLQSVKLTMLVKKIIKDYFEGAHANTRH
jgi:8-oxo-dGTP pyrophosphatase MutT (NUDIX family)